jgi:hypothetical protein
VRYSTLRDRVYFTQLYLHILIPSQGEVLSYERHCRTVALLVDALGFLFIREFIYNT